MHDIKTIRENPDAFDAALKRRGLGPLAVKILDIDERRRTAIGHLEKALARRNAASKEIGDAKRKGDNAHAEDLMIEVTQLKTAIPELEKTPRELEQQLNDILYGLPNLPLEEVPDGVDEHGNVQRHIYGQARTYPFRPKAHDDLGVALGYMDFEAAAKMSGARFVVLKRGLARLERAIGQFMLDLHTGEHGYAEINPPIMVRSPAMLGTAQLPKFRDDQFQVTTDDNRREEIKRIVETVGKAVALQGPQIIEKLADYSIQFTTKTPAESQTDETKPNHFWLIPTAEVALTNLVRESILDEKQLPMRLTALTPCFRAEAGAAGRDTRGMIRQHQFTKVELVSITTPETSKDELERMLACAEEVLRQLDLHYRVMTLCAGDMGFSSQKTYDIEVWMPGQGDGGMFREISSCSICGDFQARRMDARSRGPDGKPRFVHTLNGSGTAVGRALIAVMETYQQEDGSIAVPDVLQPYMGGLKVIARE